MTANQELDWLCRLRSALKFGIPNENGVVGIPLNRKDIRKYDEALTAQIDKLMARCYGENHRYDSLGGDKE